MILPLGTFDLNYLQYMHAYGVSLSRHITAQVRGQYRYKQSESELSVLEGSRSEHKKETNHLSLVIVPVSSNIVEDRNAVQGREWLEDMRNRVHRYRSFLQG